MNSKWNCNDVESLLTDYATGALTPADEARVLRHLEQCDRCNNAAARIAITLDLTVDALDHHPLPLSPPRTAVRRATGFGRTLRAWLDAPEEGPVTLSQWPGLLARAALVILLPVTVILGLLVPGFRLAWHNLQAPALPAGIAANANEPAGEAVILVNLLAPPVQIEPEPLNLPGAATNDAPMLAASEVPPPADSVADFWQKPVLIEALPLGTWVRAGTNDQQVDLSRVSAPILGMRVERPEPASYARPSTPAAQPKVRFEHRPRLVETLAKPPAASNRPVFEPIQPVPPGRK